MPQSALAPVSQCERVFALRDYDLSAPLASGQAFRWRQQDKAWHGVIGRRWVRLQAASDFLTAQTAAPVTDWHWLTHYLQLDLDLDNVLSTFPDDDAMRSAVAH